MAIDRTNWTALVDDDGSNTTGTLWTKDKIKTVLLDPIDAALAGGTYVIGDLIYASSTTLLSRLAGVALNQVLVSGGVGAPPAWSASPTVNGTFTAITGLQTSGSIGAAANVSVGNAFFFYWATRSEIGSPADGQLNLLNNAGSVGMGLDFTTDAVLKVRTRAQTADAQIRASFYGSSTNTVLTITTNVITPTSAVHHLGAGLIKTITVPTGFVAGSITIIPDAAFTYDATGNIVVPAGGGTAVINKAMIFTWDGTKWSPSY